MDLFAIHFCLLWFIIMVAFRMFPMNDPTNPQSLMNYYHQRNVEDRLDLIDFFRENGDEVPESALILWPDVWPLLITGVTTVICEIAYAGCLRLI